MLETLDLDGYDRFTATESFIEGLFGNDDFGRAKEMCCRNLELYPSISDRFLSEHGGAVPERMPCRNRLIDILVGVEADYDDADAVLDQYVEMGLIGPEERDYRKQSLKIHRMQMFFDNIYNYEYRKERSLRSEDVLPRDHRHDVYRGLLVRMDPADAGHRRREVLLPDGELHPGLLALLHGAPRPSEGVRAVQRPPCPAHGPPAEAAVVSRI